MNKSDFYNLEYKITKGKIDFFEKQDIIALKLNTLNRMQLIKIIELLNKQMVASTDNWEGG